MTPLPLACTVRGCRRPLERRAGAFACARGHSFDVARGGYLNLLQPQDRKSPIAGDPPAAVDARARLLDDGIGRHLLTAVANAVPAIVPLSAASVVTDLGCGTGHLLGLINGASGAVTIGIDLSARAIEVAARRAPSLQWVIANADRDLPLLTDGVDLLLSINARRNPAEAARVLAPTGALIIAVPADDDLRELREVVLGEAVGRTRVDALVAEHADGFRVVDQFATRETRRCNPAALRDLLASTYRGARRSQAQRLETLDEMDITFASDVVIFRRH